MKNIDNLQSPHLAAFTPWILTATANATTCVNLLLLRESVRQTIIYHTPYKPCTQSKGDGVQPSPDFTSDVFCYHTPSKGARVQRATGGNDRVVRTHMER